MIKLMNKLVCLPNVTQEGEQISHADHQHDNEGIKCYYKGLNKTLANGSKAVKVDTANKYSSSLTNN